MLALYRGKYNYSDIRVLRNAIQEAQLYIEYSYAECSIKPVDCKTCAYRQPCRDLQRLTRHLMAVENSGETVDN